MNPQLFPMTPVNNRSAGARRPVCGSGINDVDYNVRTRDEDGNWLRCPYYTVWISMMRRAARSYPSQMYVWEPWLKFSNFRQWIDEQPVKEWWTEVFDKKIIYPANEVFGPETCCFVPKRLNTLLHTGIGWGRATDAGRTRPYRVRARDKDGKLVHLGYFETKSECQIAYFEHKAAVLAQVREEVMETMPDRPWIATGLRRHVYAMKERARIAARPPS